nr:hypothetical protein Iba_chr14aCG23130 [Ipomoea batatas]GMD90950.1 hypothetical protein Iba_chr14dCG14670 [Ipomoea batatas]GME04602.1 hypothetical protein Iba_scaffold2300CG0140 [Ipomoea batatas]
MHDIQSAPSQVIGLHTRTTTHVVLSNTTLSHYLNVGNERPYPSHVSSIPQPGEYNLDMNPLKSS